MERKQLHPQSAKAIKWSHKRICSVPGCLYLGSADVGTATVEGEDEPVYITWGRNLNYNEQDAYLKLGMTPIWIGADDGSCELVIPNVIADTFLNM